MTRKKNRPPDPPPGQPPQTGPELPATCTFNRANFAKDAWKSYSIAELGWFVHLKTVMATHRANPVKAAKDLVDAQNYLDMMQAKVTHIRKLLEDAVAKAQKQEKETPNG